MKGKASRRRPKPPTDDICAACGMVDGDFIRSSGEWVCIDAIGCSTRMKAKKFWEGQGKKNE